MMTRAIILLIGLAFCLSCSKNKEDEKLIFNKLLGTWKLSSDAEFERFTKNDDGTFSSRVFTFAGKDTNVTEDVTIYLENTKWNFKTLVKGQNKGKSVVFTATVFNDSVVQFENREHDFPRIINYSLITPTQMRAFIAGGDTIYFYYSKVEEK
jgi:hypothetical protein